MSPQARGRSSASTESSAARLLAADEATRAAAARADTWLDVYRRSAGETLSTPNLDVLLRDALAAIGQILDADAVSLLLATDDGSELVGRAAWGLAREVDLTVSIPAGAGVSGPILATGEPRLLDDLLAEHVVSDVLRDSGQRSYAGVPLSSGGRTFGVLHATRKRVERFTSADLERLARFAEPLASAVERVRLFEAERAARRTAEEASAAAERATERVRGLQRTTAALASAATTHEICELIINEAAPGDPDEGERAIWMFQDSRLFLVAGRGTSTRYPEIPLDASFPVAAHLEEGTPLFVESKSEILRRWPVLADAPTSAFAAMPLVADGRSIGVMAVGFPVDHRFDPDEREYLAALAEQAAAALARAEARAALDEARRVADQRREQLDFLAEASERLSRSLDLDVTLETVAELGVPRITDRCALYLVEDTRITKRILAPQLNDHELRLFEASAPNLSSTDGVGAVIRTGEPEYLPEIDDYMLADSATSPEQLDLLRSVGFGGVLILPLRARGHVLGALAFVNRAGRVLGEEDRSLAEELAARAATAIDNAAMFARQAHVARRLTEALLPSPLVEIPSLDVAVRYEPSGTGLEVGGDFYDLLQISQESWLIHVGDVQGKGIEAAAVTGLARHTVSAAARYEASPAGLLRHLNSALLANIVRSARSEHPWDVARLCTAVLVRVDRHERGWTVTASSAGHPLPLVRRGDGGVTPLGAWGMMLGVVDDPHYEESTTDLEPGSSLVLYTDGASDRRSAEWFVGHDSIATVFSATAGSAREIVDEIARGALQESPDDDLMVLAVMARGGGGTDPAPSRTTPN